MVSSKALSNAPCIVMVTPQFNPINAGVSNAVTRFAFAIARGGFLVIVITPQVIDKNIMLKVGRGTLMVNYVKVPHNTRSANPWREPEQLTSTISRIFFLIKSILTIMRLKVRPLLILGETLTYSSIVAIILAKMLKLPVSIRVHGSDLDEGLVLGRGSIWTKLSVKLADILLGTNLDYYIKLRHFASRRVKVALLHNTIFKKCYDNISKRLLRRHLGLEEGFHILVVSRLWYFKGVDMVVKALKKIIERGYHDIYLHILGDGPMRNELEKYIKENNLEKHVKIYGKVPNHVVMQCMRACDIFIMPSRREGLSSALLEALTCELPIIATSVGGNRVAVLNNYNGLLFPPDNIEKLTECILKLYHDKRLRRNFSIRSRYIYIRFFSPSAVTLQLCKILKSIYNVKGWSYENDSSIINTLLQD